MSWVGRVARAGVKWRSQQERRVTELWALPCTLISGQTFPVMTSFLSAKQFFPSNVFLSLSRDEAQSPVCKISISCRCKMPALNSSVSSKRWVNNYSRVHRHKELQYQIECQSREREIDRSQLSVPRGITNTFVTTSWCIYLLAFLYLGK